MTEATTTAIDAGENSVIINGEAKDNRSQMLATTALFVTQVVAFEAKASETQKTLGHSVFNAVYADGANLDALIGDMKVAAAWPTIGTTEGGRKAKQRLEVAFSGFRLVAERWATLTDEQRAAVLDGSSSVLYLASQMRKADADAKKAADAAAKAGEAAATATATDAATVTVEPSLEDAVMALLERYQAASAEERNAAYEAIALLIETVNADVEVVDAEAVAEVANG